MDCIFVIASQEEYVALTVDFSLLFLLKLEMTLQFFRNRICWVFQAWDNTLKFEVEGVGHMSKPICHLFILLSLDNLEEVKRIEQTFFFIILNQILLL